PRLLLARVAAGRVGCRTPRAGTGLAGHRAGPEVLRRGAWVRAGRRLRPQPARVPLLLRAAGLPGPPRDRGRRARRRVRLGRRARRRPHARRRALGPMRARTLFGNALLALGATALSL